MVASIGIVSERNPLPKIERKLGQVGDPERSD
jgi:hypothetical protein